MTAERDDPLYLAPEAKAPGFAYQWFRVSIAGRPDESVAYRTRGWSPVQRADMPDEPSNDDSVIRRKDLQLYQRPKAEADAAAMALVKDALAAHRKVDELCGYAPYSGGRLFEKPAPQPIGWAQMPTPPQRWSRPLLWVEPHKRGRVVTLHEEALHPRLAAVASRFLAAKQYRFAPWRIVYLPRGETEQADFMGVSYAEWSWSKIDLVRERKLPSYVKSVVRHRYVIQINCPNWRALKARIGSTWNRIVRRKARP